MTSTPRYSIGDLARRTGLTVKTIRYYSDIGLVPETERTEAGYRLYDVRALARLELVRTLRDLDIDLTSVRRVLEHETDLHDVASAHAEAIDLQIRTLRLRRAVLRAVAKQGSTPEELDLMHKLARLSEAERQRMLDDFWDDVFGDADIDPVFVDRMRSVRVDLPDDPAPEQVAAWVELAELVGDPAFRARLREMTDAHAAARAKGEDPRAGMTPDGLPAAVAEHAGAALAAGVDPASVEGQAVVADILRAHPPAAGRVDDPAYRRVLADTVAVGTDARAERYWQLLATINGWGPIPTTVPAWEWFLAGLRA